MGTNFYYRKRGLAGEVEEKHIGKKSAKWQFMFRGYKHEDGELEIKSWQDWKAIMTRTKAGKIFDEYGEEWSAAEFAAMVEASRPGKNHTICVGYEDGTWNDPEGFSFSLTEFC